MLIRKEDDALRFAMDSGDPNIIDKVFYEILKAAEPGGYKAIHKVINLVYNIEDAMRHLRNYAKKRKDYELLD